MKYQIYALDESSKMNHAGVHEVRGGVTPEAMVKCHECGEMKSESAGRCPHCGARHDYGSYAWALIIAIGLAALMSMIFQCGN